MYYLKKNKTEKKKSSGGKKKKSPDKMTLVRKLDKIFSLYIRLRDSKPYGGKYFKCISCGQIKEFAKADCGHYFSRRHMSTRFNEDNCNAECSYCLTPDARVLTEDLYWKELGNIKEGDVLISFDEDSEERKFKFGTVTHIHRSVEDVYEVVVTNGENFSVLKATKNHKWLGRRNFESPIEWLTTLELSSTSSVCEPYEIGVGRPMLSRQCVVKSVRYVGKEEIVVMETDTHTFLANGIAMHNCNRMNAEHLHGYQENLVRKIGQQRFNHLCVLHNMTKSYSEFELQELIKYYTILVKSMQR